MEIQATIESAKLRQSNRNYKRIELTMQLLHSCLNGAFVRRIANLEKTVNANWWPLAFGTHTSRRVLVSKNAWAHDQLSALWRNTKKQTSQEGNPCIRPKFPKSPTLQSLLMHGLGMKTVLY